MEWENIDHYEDQEIWWRIACVRSKVNGRLQGIVIVVGYRVRGGLRCLQLGAHHISMPFLVNS